VGHTYGPYTPEDDAAIAHVDGAVGDILAALPPDTLVLVFADHGMHAVHEEGRLGNHGNLIARDMLVPVWVIVK
jgi:predicted AlkP superfamily pyrophosphatase or phosphodiesterase